MRAVTTLAFVWCHAVAMLAATPQRLDVPDDPGALIRTLVMPDADAQRAPFPFWVSPDDGLLIEFPYPIMSVAGRGFRVIRDERDAADVRAEWVAVPHRVPASITDPAEIPGPYTLWINPQFEVTQRVLHVTLADGKVYSFLFSTPLRPAGDKTAKPENAAKTDQPLPEPTFAYARVRFVPAHKELAQEEGGHGEPNRAGEDSKRRDREPVTAASQAATEIPGIGANATTPPTAESNHVPSVVRMEMAPDADLRASTPEAEGGLIDFVRMLGSLPRKRAEEAAAQSPVFQTVFLEADENTSTFGATHKVRTLCVCRDSTSGAIGVGVVIENLTNEVLGFDPQSWMLRVGHGAIYAATGARGGMEVGPKAKVFAQFVVGRDAQGNPLKVAIANVFTPSVRLVGRSPAKPIQSIPINLP